MSVEFTWWRSALSGSFGPIHENLPQPGYYRTKPLRGEAGAPVAIWFDGENLRALRSGRPVDPFSVWTWCCQHPVSHEAYVAVAEQGGSWPDDIPGIGQNRKRRSKPNSGSQRRSRTAGRSLPERARKENRHSPPLHEALLTRVAVLRDEALAWLAEMGPPQSQDAADRTANYAILLADIEREAEEERSREKQPILQAGRDVDRRWKPVIASAEEAKRQLKGIVEGFLVARLEALSEAAAFGGIKDEDLPRAGTLGRRIGLRTEREVSVIDRAVLLAAYRDDARLWESRDVEKLVLALAERDLAAGRSVPGALLVERKVAV